MRKLYQARRVWAIQRLGGKCVRCGSVDNLEVDHIDPATKSCHPFSGASLAWSRFVTEIDKCQLLCRFCHLEKTRTEGSLEKNHARGERVCHAKLTEYDVILIRQLYGEGTTQQVLADRFGVGRSNIGHIVNCRTWTHVPG